MIRKDVIGSWETLQECIDQHLIKGCYLSKEFKQNSIAPKVGFRMEPVMPEDPSYNESLVKAREVLRTKRDKKKIRQVTTNSLIPNSKLDLKLEKEENKYITILKSADKHKKGSPYSVDAMSFFKMIYVTSPKVIEMMHQCRIAPDPKTVYNWVSEDQKTIIEEIEDESGILEVIHRVTDQYTKDINEEIPANLAGDCVYLEEKGKKHCSIMHFNCNH